MVNKNFILRTKTQFYDNITIDNITFTANTPITLNFGFPFWKLSTNNSLIKNSMDFYESDTALQLRNASNMNKSQERTAQSANQKYNASASQGRFLKNGINVFINGS